MLKTSRQAFEIAISGKNDLASASLEYSILSSPQKAETSTTLLWPRL